MAEYIEREAFLTQKREQYCKDCARRKGMRNGKYKTLYEIGEAPCRACEIDDVLNDVEDFPAADVRPVPAGGIGEMSDGYHTFNGLYYQRMVLFAALVKAHKDKAWKSWRHEDGELCFGGGWFIVGIDTPEGSFTYHYDKMYWNLFECKELPTAKHWDGHTEKDVTRLLSLDVRPVVRGKWKLGGYGQISDATEKWYDQFLSGCFFYCSACKERSSTKTHFCPNCGADMREES